MEKETLEQKTLMELRKMAKEMGLGTTLNLWDKPYLY